MRYIVHSFHIRVSYFCSFLKRVSSNSLTAYYLIFFFLRRKDHFMDGILPENIASGLIALLIISFLLLVILPAIIVIQRFLRKATLAEMQQYRDESPYEAAVGACIGLGLINGFLYVVERPILPRDFFYAAIDIINFVVLCFVVYHLLNRLLIQIRTSILLKQA